MNAKYGLLRILIVGGCVFSVVQARAQHTLIVHLPLDTADSQDNILAYDTSGNGNQPNFGTGGGGGGVFGTNDAVAGGGAAYFSGGPDGFGVGSIGWAPIPPQLSQTMSGSFTVSCWVKTTQQIAFEGSPAWNGAGIISGDVDGSAYDYTPMGLTGGEIAFTTGGGPDGGDDTLSSSFDSITNGVYHLVTVTRNVATGEKQIYIDGIFDNSDTGTTNLLTDTQQIDLGSVGDGGNSNVDGSYFYNQYNGDIDDLQIYAGVLSADEIAYIYNNPGLAVPDMATPISPNLVAYYTFDDTNRIGADSSGLGNDLDFNSTAGGGEGVMGTNDSEAGSAAAYFDGGSFLTYSSAPASVLSTLGSSFTLSVWIKTTGTYGYDGDPAWEDPAIVNEDIPGLARDIVPLAVTGASVGMNTGDDPNHYSTGESSLSSYTTVNDGYYHHVVVTRDEATGVRQIYVDGLLSVSDTATTYYLRDPVQMAVGAKTDASQADPNNEDSGGPYFQGEMDDMQIYNRVLTADEIYSLYSIPGSIATNAAPAPVDITMSFEIFRETDPTFVNYYLAFPETSFEAPALITTNFIRSPYGNFVGFNSADESYSSSSDTENLSDVIDEFTNSYWTIAINAGDPSEQIFHFKLSANGFTSDFPPAFSITDPVNGSLFVPTNTPLQWIGPTNFSAINVSVESDNYTQYVSGSFGPEATNWTSPPILLPGINRFDVDYTSNDFPGITFGGPANSVGAGLDLWTVTTDLHTETISQFTVIDGGPQPVNIVDVVAAANGIQFSFTSQPGTTNTLQSTTNLSGGLWMDVTNFMGDGNVWQFVYPTTNPPVRFFRVKTQ